jgi:polysaccharide export outer membrane protein
MSATANTTVSAQPGSTHLNERLNQVFSFQKSPSGVLPLVAGTVTLLAILLGAVPQPADAQTQAATETQTVPTQPVSNTPRNIPRNTTPSAQAQRSSPSSQAAPRRGIILTPALPNRTIVPPPTSAFPYEEAYTLGPSDQIQIDIFDVPELSGAAAGRYIVQLDGTVNLTWAGVVRVQGLTLQQAEAAITQAYAPYVRNPRLTVSLVTTRSLRISVAGEVKRPGAYVISPEGATDNRILVEAAGPAGGVANQWPTVTKALQAAGGITQFADLRRLQVRRPLADGSLEVIDVNLWELLRTGELNQDIRLRDRDTLVIPTATALNDSEALVTGAANFSPQTIRVNVVGAVQTPGVVEVPPNTPLNQALLAAGGFDPRRARMSQIDLVRLNSNGTAVRRTVKVDLAAGINDATNPPLRDYDTIVVSRNGRTATSERIEDTLAPVNSITAPIGSFFGVLDIFNTFGNN